MTIIVKGDTGTYVSSCNSLPCHHQCLQQCPFPGMRMMNIGHDMVCFMMPALGSREAKKKGTFYLTPLYIMIYLEF